MQKTRRNMKYFVVLFSVFILCACSGKTTSDKKSISPEYEVSNSIDMDVSKIKRDNECYLILFDGTSIKGWRGYGKTDLPDKWQINEGCLYLNQSASNGGDIIFDCKFRNFELELDWKISKAGNSGIFYLAREIKAKDPITDELKLQPIFVSAPECQILDNDNHPDAKLGTNGSRKAGSLYDIIAAEPQSAKPFGEWNHVRITVNNGKVTHQLNGVMVVEYSFLGQSWIDLLNASKFGKTKWPLAFELMRNCGGEKHEGYIGLQDIGDEVWFKNIKAKVLN